MSHGSLFSSWNHMEPLLRLPAHQQTDTASIRKSMVRVVCSVWVRLHASLQRNHAIHGVPIQKALTHLRCFQPCLSLNTQLSNRQLFANWMIKLEPFNPFEVDVCNLFFRKRGVPESYLTAAVCQEGSPSPLRGSQNITRLF